MQRVGLRLLPRPVCSGPQLQTVAVALPQPRPDPTERSGDGLQFLAKRSSKGHHTQRLTGFVDDDCQPAALVAKILEQVHQPPGSWHRWTLSAGGGDDLEVRERVMEDTAARKRLLHTRYLGWASGTRTGQGLISPSAERIAHAPRGCRGGCASDG